ncbi:hypothetical protein C3L33_06406, partial [Rhododendron williamsianum]
MIKWESLNSDLLLHIFLRLEPLFLLSTVAFVCRPWGRLCFSRFLTKDGEKTLDLGGLKCDRSGFLFPTGPYGRIGTAGLMKLIRAVMDVYSCDDYDRVDDGDGTRVTPFTKMVFPFGPFVWSDAHLVHVAERMKKALIADSKEPQQSLVIALEETQVRSNEFVASTRELKQPAPELKNSMPLQVDVFHPDSNVMPMESSIEFSHMHCKQQETPNICLRGVEVESKESDAHCMDSMRHSNELLVHRVEQEVEKVMEIVAGQMKETIVDPESNMPLHSIMFSFMIQVIYARCPHAFCRSPDLRELTLPCGSEITHKGFSRALRYWNEIEKMSIGPFRNNYDVYRIIEAAGIICKKLEVLSLSGFFVNLQLSPQIAQNLKGVKLLRLEKAYIGKVALKNILSKCKKLQKVEIWHCLTLEGNESDLLASCEIKKTEVDGVIKWSLVGDAEPHNLKNLLNLLWQGKPSDVQYKEAWIEESKDVHREISRDPCVSHHRSSFGGAFTFNSSSLPTVAVILNMYENRYACYAFLEVEADHRRSWFVLVLSGSNPLICKGDHEGKTWECFLSVSNYKQKSRDTADDDAMS